MKYRIRTILLDLLAAIFLFTAIGGAVILLPLIFGGTP